MTALYNLSILVCVLYPWLADARTVKDDAGVILNDNGTYSISRFFSPDERTSPSTLDYEAEAFCAKLKKHYLNLSTGTDTHLWTIVFKCTTNKKEAERQKRLREIPLRGKHKNS